MMTPEDFLRVTKQQQPPLNRGGQHLILYEVMALLAPFDRIWLPFPVSCKALRAALGMFGTHVSEGWQLDMPLPQCGAMYFGTPTIVDGQPLFVEDAGVIHTKDIERHTVRQLCSDYVVEASGLQRIVCGLGLGDITVDERLDDVGKGAEVVTMKKFDEFTDWIIAREIENV